MRPLILASRMNSHAKAVAKEFHRRQYDYVWLDSDFPEKRRVSLVEGSLIMDGNVLTLAFSHNPNLDSTRQEREFLDDLDRKLYFAEWRQMIANICSLTAIKWFNRPISGYARCLAKQQSIALELGLKIPRTIFTNSAKELRNYFADFDGDVVIKPGNLDIAGETSFRILTNKVKIHDIDVGVLRNAPCFFQEYINKQHELRIYVMGHRILACKIESQASMKSRIDWRRYDLPNTPYIQVQLKDRIKQALICLVHRLDLGYGAIDMIVTPGDEYVFLECNTNPSWLWVEELTGLQITWSIVESMLESVSEPS